MLTLKIRSVGVEIQLKQSEDDPIPLSLTTYSFVQVLFRPHIVVYAGPNGEGPRDP